VFLIPGGIDGVDVDVDVDGVGVGVVKDTIVANTRVFFRKM
jgi:hypothetical protein